MQHDSVITDASTGARSADADWRSGTSRVNPAQLAAARRVLEKVRSHGPSLASEPAPRESKRGAEAH